LGRFREFRVHGSAVRNEEKLMSYTTKPDTTDATEWWLTLAAGPGRCATCPARWSHGARIVYRHEPQETRCFRCGSELEDSKGFLPSARWVRVLERREASDKREAEREASLRELDAELDAELDRALLNSGR
jgi:hypothetical protein